jgi:hypothetical protein
MEGSLKKEKLYRSSLLVNQERGLESCLLQNHNKKEFSCLEYSSLLPAISPRGQIIFLLKKYLNIEMR